MAETIQIEQLWRGKNKYTVITDVSYLPEKEILKVAQIAADKHFSVKIRKKTGERRMPDGVYTPEGRRPVRVEVFDDYGFVQVNVMSISEPELTPTK